MMLTCGEYTAAGPGNLLPQGFTILVVPNFAACVAAAAFRADAPIA